MEACQGVEREIIKVVEKFHCLGEANHRALEEAMQHVRAARDEIREGKVFKKIFSSIQILNHHS